MMSNCFFICSVCLLVYKYSSIFRKKILFLFLFDQYVIIFLSTYLANKMFGKGEGGLGSNTLLQWKRSWVQYLPLGCMSLSIVLVDTQEAVAASHFYMDIKP